MNAQRAAQLLEAGLWLQMSGDVEGARRLFEQALKLDPSNARAQQLMAGASAPSAAVGAAAGQGQGPRTPTPPPASPPRRPPEPPAAPADDRGGEFDLNWGGNADPEGSAGSGAGEPPQTMVMFHAVGERLPTPPPVPAQEQAAPEEPAPEVPLAMDFTDPDELPVQLPGPPVSDEAAPVIRPVTFAEDATSAWDSQSNPGVHIGGIVPQQGDVMDMVSEPQSPLPPPAASEAPQAVQRDEPDVTEEVATLIHGARDLLELDDHSGAIELILKAQQLAPNDPEVQALRERSEQTLQAMFESRIGLMTARPRVVLKDDEIIWLNLDHRAGFVLAQIDGSVSFEDLFEVCGMSRLDTARILAQLVDEGVIGV